MKFAWIAGGPENDFRPRFRYEIAALGVFACAVFVFVAVQEPWPAGLFFFGFCGLLLAILFSTLRRERKLLRDYSVARGTVLYFRRGESSFGKGKASLVTYMFEAPDGETYENKSEILTPRTLREDKPILVLYKPSDPKQNQASTGFMFYRFRRLLKRL
jgi:Protein of unknown function (DUF3592)